MFPRAFATQSGRCFALPLHLRQYAAAAGRTSSVLSCKAHQSNCGSFATKPSNERFGSWLTNKELGCSGRNGVLPFHARFVQTKSTSSGVSSKTTSEYLDSVVGRCTRSTSTNINSTLLKHRSRTRVWSSNRISEFQEANVSTNKRNTSTTSSSDERHFGRRITDEHNMRRSRRMGRVHIHPLSQIVLQYLQDSCHEWVKNVGLERLTLNRDGTFILRFPRNPGLANDAIETDNNNPNSGCTQTTRDKLWTYYDSVKKQHWLAVQKGALKIQCLLQAEMKPSWHPSNVPITHSIHHAVEEMIASIDKFDSAFVQNKDIGDVVTSHVPPPQAPPTD